MALSLPPIRDDSIDWVRLTAELAAIVESCDDAIVSKDLSGTIRSWNGGAERLFGYSADEAIGRNILMLIPPDRTHEESQIIERLRRGERVDHFESVRIAKDGRPIHVSLTISPVRDATGEIVGASKVARDIGDRIRAAEALREADRHKDEFIAMLAHELRNPLAPIANSLEILRECGTDRDAIERVHETLARQTAHLTRLVDDLMEISRITRERLELRKERIDLAEIVQTAVEIGVPSIEAFSQRFELELSQEKLALYADPVRIAQVIANLLNNAAKFTAAGGRIQLKVQRDRDTAVIRVRDDGVGIPPDMLEKVFELFRQVGNPLDRAQGGLGIGLTLVRRLVEMHGGTVLAHSAGLGHGAEFVVRLPLAPADVAAETRAPSSRRLPSIAGRRILVVDDHEDSANSFGALLKLSGADVRTVYSGEAALEAIASYRPSVIFLDIGMPGMNGYELARRTRAQFPEAGHTLVALTGWGHEETLRQTKAAGIDHHLVKPVDYGALIELLATLPPASTR
jgi:PAS domain S-box-containing protein